LLATEQHVGVEMECPSCQHTFTVPAYQAVIDKSPRQRRKYQLNSPSEKTIRKDEHGQPVFKSKLTWENYASKAFDQLKGMCHGILADGAIADEEVKYFRAWIEKNSAVETTWPFSEIAEKVRSLYSGEVVSEEERKGLKEIMKAITGGSFLPSLDDDTSTDLPLCDPQPTKIEFYGMEFCVTGRFGFGTRKKVETEIVNRGGTCNPTPRVSTSYLVIGCFASRDWKFSNYGTKIDRAVELRDQKTSISIISEETWTKSL
jgi:NAD-dependent DNA ligase